MGIFSTMMWNAIHMATHGLTTVNKRVETLKSCRRHAKGVVTKVISPLRLLVIILLLLKSNIQFHHECYRTIAALLAQQVVHHKLESDSLCQLSRRSNCVYVRKGDGPFAGIWKYGVLHPIL